MLRRYFTDNKNSEYDIDGLGIYRCPRFIAGKDMLIYRPQYIKKGTSPMSEAWEKFVSSVSGNYRFGELSYIKEFPIPIMNTELFLNLAGKIDSTKIGKMRKSKYYVLDYFFYNLGLTVELDSHFHDRRSYEDQVRDAYMTREYGIGTLRVDGYSVRKNPTGDKALEQRFLGAVDYVCSNKIKNGYRRCDPFKLDFLGYTSGEFNRVSQWDQLLEISTKIFDEFLVPGRYIQVPITWLVQRYPNWAWENQDIKSRLVEFFMDQYMRELVIK